MSRLEDEVRAAVEGGYNTLHRLEPLRLFQWAAKILFGTLFREIDLAMDRSAAESATILPPTHLEHFASLHDLLQSVRVSATFVGGPFYSVLVAPVHDLGGWRPFDFADSVDDQVVGLRLGEVGLVASLADGGLASEHWTRILAAFGNHPMHRIQFDEMLALVVGLKQRMARPIRMAMAANVDDGSNFTFIRPGSFSLAPLVGEFDPEQLRPLLRHYLRRWGANTDPIWSLPKLGTTIFGKEGHVALCDASFQLLRVVPYE